MATVMRRFQNPDLLAIFGVVVLVVGFHGYTRSGSTLVARSPAPTIWDVRVTELTLQAIAYTDGCNYMWGPSHVILWPVGVAVILLAGGIKAAPVFSDNNRVQGIGILLVGSGLIIGSELLLSGTWLRILAFALVTSSGIAMLVVGWLRE